MPFQRRTKEPGAAKETPSSPDRDADGDQAGEEPFESEPGAPEDGPSIRSDTQEYRLAHVEFIPVGFLNELVHSVAAGPSRLLPAPTADLLKRCGAFDTIRGHAEALVDDLMLDADQVPVIVEQLRAFARDGLLVSRADIGREWTRPGTPSSPTAITTVAMLTRDRLPTAQRCLESYISSIREQGRTVDFAVLDDSPEEGTRADYRRMLRALAEKYHVPIAYGGLEEKRRFAGWLVEAGMPGSVVDFALFGMEPCRPTMGANHNAILLHTAGDPILSVDDDTICRLVSPPGSGGGIELSSRPDPTQFWFFADRDSVLESANVSQVDILVQHEHLLGRSLRECVVSGGGPDRLVAEEVSAFMLSLLDRDGGRVLATVMGQAGDSGMEISIYNLFQRGPSFHRLTRSPQLYSRLVATREVQRCVLRPTVSEGAQLMATAVGLDNRVLLPPFFPVQRNHDGIFGISLRTVFPEGFIGYLPWMITHEPPQVRTTSRPHNLKLSTRMRTSDVLITLIQLFELPGGAWLTDQRIKALGRHLTELGSLKTEDFEDVVRKQLWRLAGGHATMVEQLLEEQGDEPDYWAEDVQEYLDALLQAAIEPDFAIPRDLAELCGLEEAPGLLQQLVGRYGELLEIWPDFVETVRRFRKEGKRLAGSL